jgi:sec-independent protein translocase protein TatB
MFGDIGWAELMLIGIVALIVIGPEDLPDMFRQLGRFTAKLRQMSREFSRTMEQAAKDSGVKDVADDLKGITSAKSLGLNKVKEAADRFEKWDPIKNAAKPSAMKSPMPATVAPDPVTGPEPTIHGAATQALLDKQAAKKAILEEATAKLKAVEAPPEAAPEELAVQKPTPKPRAPRKKKADIA